MKNFEEQAQEILDRNINLIKICEENLKEQNRRYKVLKSQIIEWEGALIRANLPFKKITYKGKDKNSFWRVW